MLFASLCTWLSVYVPHPLEPSLNRLPAHGVFRVVPSSPWSSYHGRRHLQVDQYLSSPWKSRRFLPHEARYTYWNKTKGFVSCRSSSRRSYLMYPPQLFGGATANVFTPKPHPFLLVFLYAENSLNRFTDDTLIQSSSTRYNPNPNPLLEASRGSVSANSVVLQKL